jgi:hypothetical protein
MSIIKTERLLGYIHAPTRRRYVILTTLFAFRAQQLFFPPSTVRMYVCVREKKRIKIFVLLKELAYTHLMYECKCGRKKSACVWSRSDNDNVTKLRKEKEEKRALYLWPLG